MITLTIQKTWCDFLSMSNNVHHVLFLLSCKMKYYDNKKPRIKFISTVWDFRCITSNKNRFPNPLHSLLLKTQSVKSFKTVTPSKTIIYSSNVSLWNLLHSLDITRGAKIHKREICIYIWSEKLVQSLLELKSLSVSQLERSGWDNITAPAREGFNFEAKLK